MQQRDNTISIAKGIGIILMVAQHAQIPVEFRWVIEMFDMPLFFLLSGYCFKEKYLVDPVQFLTNKIKGIYKPCVKYSFLFILLHNTFSSLHIIDYCDLYTLSDIFKRIAYLLIRLDCTEQLLGGYWFMKQLFFASLISFICVKLLHKTGIVFLFTMTILFSIYNTTVPVLGISSLTFLSSLLHNIGIWGRRYDFMSKVKWRLFIPALLIVVAGSLYVKVGMLSYTVLLLAPYIIAAISGTYVILLLSKCINKNNNLNRFLIFTGNHTLEILTWHLLCFKLVSLIMIQTHNLNYSMLSCFPVIPGFTSYSIIYTSFGVTIPLIIAYLKDLQNKQKQV